MQRLQCLAIALVCSLGAACNKPGKKDGPTSTTATPEDVKAKLDPQRAALEGVGGKLQEAIDAGKKHPALSALSSAPPADPNAILLADEERSTFSYSDLYCAPSNWKYDILFEQLAEAKTLERYDLEQIEKAIPTVLAAKAALVCRSTRLDPLVIDNTTKSFSGGHLEAECRLFELETTKYLGGFTLNTDISEKLTSFSRGNASPHSFSLEMTAAASTGLNTALWGDHAPAEGLRYVCNFP